MDMPLEEVATLKEKGYNWPSPRDIDKQMIDIGKPKGYPKVEGTIARICQTLAEMRHYVGEWMLASKKAPWSTMTKGIHREHKKGHVSHSMYC